MPDVLTLQARRTNITPLMYNHYIDDVRFVHR